MKTETNFILQIKSSISWQKYNVSHTSTMNILLLKLGSFLQVDIQTSHYEVRAIDKFWVYAKVSKLIFQLNNQIETMTYIRICFRLYKRIVSIYGSVCSCLINRLLSVGLSALAKKKKRWRLPLPLHLWGKFVQGDHRRASRFPIQPKIVRTNTDKQSSTRKEIGTEYDLAS